MLHQLVALHRRLLLLTEILHLYLTSSPIVGADHHCQSRTASVGVTQLLAYRSLVKSEFGGDAAVTQALNEREDFG